MENAWLIVGLGNPGDEYSRTRHNAGFMAVDALAARWRVELRAERKFKARLGRAERDQGTMFLCQPQTYMNASGEAVGRVAEFYRIPHERVLVVVDDADLPLGEIRLRPRGSSGGHHGLDSVEQHLATREFPRLRLGIGRRESGLREITGHVLGPFPAGDMELLEVVLGRACDQMECWLRHGVLEAMNRFNGKVNI